MAAHTFKPLESAMRSAASHRRFSRPHIITSQSFLPHSPARSKRLPRKPTWSPTVDQSIEPDTAHLTCSAYGTAQPQEYAIVAEDESVKWKRHVLFCAVALGLASVHRVTLAVLAVPFQHEFGLSLPQMGILQSSILWGYVLGQLPSGVLADKVGGSPLMIISLLCWCFASALTPLARSIPQQHIFAYIVGVRALLGLAQSGIVTSTSAMIARWVPSEHRSKAMGFCYFLFSGGVVVSMLATPFVAKPFGWPAAFKLYSLLGLLWAAWGYVALAPEEEATNQRQLVAHPRAAAKAQPAAKARLPLSHKVQVGVLIWTHCVISWGFTLLQNWIPTILASMGMRNLESVGAISALPWLAASTVSLFGGLLSDWLHNSRGWQLVEIRRFCQNLATVGPAIALAYLGFMQCSVPLAVFLLVATAALQAFCYAGFHSYVQDVAPKDAGRLLGMTNTGGTMLGVACNILTGRLAASPAGFSAVFCLAAAVYLSSAVTWNLLIRGDQLDLSDNPT